MRTHTPLSVSLVATAIAALLATSCSESDLQKDAPITAKSAPEIVQKQATLSQAGEGTVTEFGKRVKEYIALQKELDGTLTRLPDRATPQQIDTHQRALGALVAKARSDAKVGDIFTPEMQTFVRGLVRSVLTGSDGPRIKASLMDENPMGVKLTINGRYPDTVPLATMPPDVLAAMPPLPEGLEYRFVGNRLILLDPRAHVVVDLVENAFDI